MIGKTIYVYNVNRRVYRRREDGRSFGSPIYREHWEPRKVVGETRVSWVLDRSGEKVPKKGADNVVFSEEELDRRCWIEDNRRHVADAIRRLDNYSLLWHIADLIGYVPQEDKD